jgi:hypothetical protein
VHERRRHEKDLANGQTDRDRLRQTKTNIDRQANRQTDRQTTENRKRRHRYCIRESIEQEDKKDKKS